MDQIVLTFDVDWAPEFAIDFVADRLASAGASATWFVTDANGAVDRLRERRELFELGIHPNFHPGSTHGEDRESVLRHCMHIVPEAETMRSHGLLSSTVLLIEALAQTPVRADLSVLPQRSPGLMPSDFWWRGRRLVRIPTFWEDDLEFEAPQPSFRFDELAAVGPGLKVLSFHPTLVYLNASSPEPYAELRRRVGDVRHATEADCAALVQSGRGSRALLDDVLELPASQPTSTVRDITRRWLDRDAEGGEQVAD